MGVVYFSFLEDKNSTSRRIILIFIDITGRDWERERERALLKTEKVTREISGMVLTAEWCVSVGLLHLVLRSAL